MTYSYYIWNKLQELLVSVKRYSKSANQFLIFQFNKQYLSRNHTEQSLPHSGYFLDI